MQDRAAPAPAPPTAAWRPHKRHRREVDRPGVQRQHDRRRVLQQHAEVAAIGRVAGERHDLAASDAARGVVRRGTASKAWVPFTVQEASDDQPSLSRITSEQRRELQRRRAPSRRRRRRSRTSRAPAPTVTRSQRMVSIERARRRRSCSRGRDRAACPRALAIVDAPCRGSRAAMPMSKNSPSVWKTRTAPGRLGDQPRINAVDGLRLHVGIDAGEYRRVDDLDADEMKAPAVRRPRAECRGRCRPSGRRRRRRCSSGRPSTTAIVTSALVSTCCAASAAQIDVRQRVAVDDQEAIGGEQRHRARRAAGRAEDLRSPTSSARRGRWPSRRRRRA